MTWLIGFDAEPRENLARLACYNGTTYTAFGVGRKTFEIDDPPPTGGAILYVEAPGYKSKDLRCILPVFDGTQSVYFLSDDHGALIKSVTLDPAVVQLPALHVEGRDFVTAEGQRHVICGSTELLLAWRYDLEGADAIRPVLVERRDIGFNNLRVLWQKGNDSNIPVSWQMPVDKMPPFLALAAEHDFYIQGVILANCQAVNPGEQAQQLRVQQVREATAGITNHIEQLGNEYGPRKGDYGKNGFNPWNFARPTDRLAANASSTEGGEYAPFWDFMCFSGRRSPLNGAIREYGPIEFMYGGVVQGVSIPAICDEGMKPGINSFERRDYERAGAQGRSGAGARYHSPAGTSGNSCLFNELEYDCAVGFVEGMKG